VSGHRGESDCLLPAGRDLIARIVHDPAGIQDLPSEEILGDSLTIDEYVELSAIAAKVVAIDLLCVGLGAPLLPMPHAGAGNPTRVRPGAAQDLGARVPMLTAEDLTLEIGPGVYHVNVRRGHSLIPEEAALQNTLIEALYVPDLLTHGLAGRRGLDRVQLEAMATRVSALNRCYYCSTGHSQLLTMANGGADGIDLPSIVGGQSFGGVKNGTELGALVDAMVRDQSALDSARTNALAVLTEEQFLGAVATIAAFVMLNRVSDTSGIPLDEIAVVLLDSMPNNLGFHEFPGNRRDASRG